VSAGKAARDLPQEPAAPEAAPGKLRQLWDQVGTLLLAVAIALSVRACVIEPFRIPSGSMLPTLLIGDHLFVNKFLYGAKVPFTELRLPALRAPKRGDVVVFDVAKDATGIYPADRRPNLPTESFVKRLVGLPGDTIEVRAGQLVINGQPVSRDPTGETFSDKYGRSFEVRRENLEGHEHLSLDDPANPGREGRFVVEPGRYLMMGDNRDDSNDGRYWGTVRLEELKGPAFILYWSWDFDGGWTSLLSPLTWWDLFVHKMRWGRIGDPVI
jgi:signal peptidase I